MSVRRPAMAPRVARHIDRLARRVHAFHRFAHHPLCDEYAGEVYRAGNRVFCRGCVGGILGAVVGIAAGWVLMPEGRVQLAAIALGTAGLAARRGWLLRRTVPAIALNVPFGAVLARPTVDRAWVAALAFVLATAVYLRYRRRGPNRSPCVACPERTFAPCRGFEAAFRAEAVFRRAAARAMAKGPLPPIGEAVPFASEACSVRREGTGSASSRGTPEGVWAGGDEVVDVPQRS